MTQILSSLGIVLNATLMYTPPLLFAALGSCFSEKSGVVNIGLEGMIIIGAFTGAAVGCYIDMPWIAFLCAGAAGGLLALLHAFATVTCKADQTISGTAINFLASGLSVYICIQLFNSSETHKVLEKLPRIFDDAFMWLRSGLPASLEATFASVETAAFIESLPAWLAVPATSLMASLPDTLRSLFGQNSFIDLVFNGYASTYLAFLFVFITWLVFYRTRFGLRLRAVGEHPRAADTLGVNVYLVRYACVILSGILAGFGGATITLATISQFRPSVVVGQGFIAIAAVIFGKFKPQGAMWGCILFGFCNGLKVVLGNEAVFGIKNVIDVNIYDAVFNKAVTVFQIPLVNIISMIPYIVTIVILVLFVGRAQGPAANGKPYIKSK